MAKIEEKQNMFEIVQQIKSAFKEYDIKKLREINNICEKNILTDERLYFTLALLSYTLAKVLTKGRFRNPSLYQKIDVTLFQALNFAKTNDEIAVINSSWKILEIITNFDEKDKRYIIGLIEKGRTKIAASLYAQGLSLSRVISITGAQKHEVLNYSGKTVMADRVGKTISVKERLSIAKRILKR
ncbi:MAG: hypothetical protein NZ903_02200 [Candidatus Micrarchaeota archaeon]|nr:hypothetical protein [Candidatus Micrarchaeota archaeon]